MGGYYNPLDPSTFPDDDPRRNPLETPRIAGLGPKPLGAVNLPGLAGPQLQKDEAEQQRLNTTGPGVDQFAQAHPVIGGIAKVADTLGGIVAPNIARNIPGTTLHHQQLEGRNEAAIGQDVSNEQKEAQAANLNAQPELKSAANDIKQEQVNNQELKNQATQEHQQSALDAQYRKMGLKRDATGQVVPVPYEEMSPTEQAVHDLKTNQADAAEARAELDKMKGDPNSPMYQLQLKRLQVAQQNSQNAASRLQLSTDQFANKLQEQELIKPSGQTQSRGSSAQVALNSLPHVEDLIRKNSKTMGPILGRIAKGEIAVGNVDPATAEVYTALKSMYALQPSVHGFRSAEFVKDLETAVGNIERNPQAVIAGLEGLKPTLQQVATEGKTYHKRVVEGREQQPQQTQQGGGDLGPAPAGKGEGATGTMPDGTRVKVQNGRLVKQ